MGTERPRLREILTDDWAKFGTDTGMSIGEIAKALAPLGGMSAGTLQSAMAIGESLGRKLGLKSSKRKAQTFAAPYAIFVRALVLALASERYVITALFDTPKGAFIEAQLPKDFRSLGGTLRFDVLEEGADTVHLVALCDIKGQIFDWGKGTQALNDVVEKTELFASRLRT